MKKLYTPQQVADMLQFGKASVLKWIRDGKLKAVRVGRRALRVRQDDLDEFLQKHKV